MNAQDQLKALQQILQTLNIAAARQSEESFKKDGIRMYTTAIQNTKKLMNFVEERIVDEKELIGLFDRDANLDYNIDNNLSLHGV